MFSKQFIEMRSDAFESWCAGAVIPGIKRETFRGILAYLLSKQTKFGEWGGDGDRWEVVQTAVVLKSLAAMCFRRGDSWAFDYRGQHVEGSVDSALRFIEQELNNRSTENVGEDIWDACQALLAVAAFGDRAAGVKHAKTIAADWSLLYERACKAEDGTRWRGPAYLAAMVDVLLCYGKDLEEEYAPHDPGPIIAALVACEDKTGGQPTGEFPATSPEVNINRWTTSLVLRSLAHAPNPDYALIERSANWLINQLKNLKGIMAIAAEAPMYLARALEGLSAARHLVQPEILLSIDAVAERANHRLESFWNDDPTQRTGSLKTYTAVSEYLGSLRFSVPAGLILDLPQAAAKPADRAADAPPAEAGRPFIVHGRDLATVRELQVYVQNTLKLGTPIVLQDQPSEGNTVIEKFEREAANVSLVFVVMTPDDLGGLDTEELRRRARQNVIYEMGYFAGKLRRKSGRVLLLCKGNIELPSDIAGVIYIDISHGIAAAGEQIRLELRPILEERRGAGGL